MRFLLYNIRYGTGEKQYLFPWSGYLRNTTQNIRDITEFIRTLEPDIIGLLEVDAGSYRSAKRNQAQVIAEALGHCNTYKSKYSKFSVTRHLPLMNKQGNAFITRSTIKNQHFHYFDHGVKKLVIELELEHLNIFLVHLALTFRTRHNQLSDLYSLVKEKSKPVIVAGDFNVLWGDREIKLFLAATGLSSAGANVATYPSWAPKRNLDFILHGKDIIPTAFFAPKVTLSDHLPLVCDFTIKGVPETKKRK